jgi:hypothetical protein
MSHALLRVTKRLPLTVLLPFLTAQSSLSLARTYTESSSTHFNSFSLWNISEKDLYLYTSYSHGELARDSSCLHQVAGRMPGIEANTDQLACLVAQIETEAFECPSASCSWVCPAGDERAGLMRDIFPSHLGDERTDISSMGFEPPVVKDMKPHVSSDQQKESSAKR